MKKALIVAALFVVAVLTAILVRSEFKADEATREANEAAQITQLAKENYVKHLSLEGLKEQQNEVLADCMIEKLTPFGRRPMTLATSERDAKVAMLAGGRNLVDDDCLSRAINETD